MPLQGEYEPSSSEWVRDQVEEYESSGGTKGTTLRGVPVVVIVDSTKYAAVSHVVSNAKWKCQVPRQNRRKAAPANDQR